MPGLIAVFLHRPRKFDEFLRITVTDSGIGISPEGLEHLFKPFSQIDSGLSRKFEGTGLGLAMVKLLAELHGGAVAVESAVDEGSRFTVWLPFGWQKTGSLHQGAGRNSVGGSGRATLDPRRHAHRIGRRG